MKRFARPAESDGSGATRAVTDTPLSGWRLIVMRTAVLTISAVTVIVGVYALILWPRLAVPCEDPASSCLFTPEQAAAVGRLGYTPTQLALAIVAINLVAIALTNGVAAMLLLRRSDDAMALLVAMTLILLPAFFSPMYIALTGVGGVWSALARALNHLGGVSFLLLLGLFPSGRFTPRWIWLPLLALVAVGSGVLQPAAAIGLPIAIACLVSIVSGQVYRYRRVSTPVQRQQTKWAVAGFVLAILINQLFWQPDAWIPALQRKDSLYPLLLYPDFALMISVLAVAFGVAIIRYRLYNIDVIIRQTLVYTALTAILAAVYFGAVIGAQSVAQRLTGISGQHPVVTVASTLLIAVLFTPLRRRIQTAIDRAFYRSKYDTLVTLNAFGARMRIETDLEPLCDDFVDAVRQTMQPAHAFLWLAPQSREARYSSGQPRPADRPNYDMALSSQAPASAPERPALEGA